MVLGCHLFEKIIISVERERCNFHDEWSTSKTPYEDGCFCWHNCFNKFSNYFLYKLICVSTFSECTVSPNPHTDFKNSDKISGRPNLWSENRDKICVWSHIECENSNVMCIGPHLDWKSRGGTLYPQIRGPTLSPMGIGLTTLGIEGHNR